MAASIRQFHTELFEQHLEEASFLYEQRLAFFDDPEMSWQDLDDFEERFEAHVDALVVGADHALEICKARCSAGDFGELHTAIRVFCRRGKSELVYAVLQRMDVEDPDVVRAAVDALRAECPESWHDDLVRIMLGSRKELIPALAAVLAYRRAPVEDTLLRVLPSCPPEQAERVLWALGRIGSDKSRAALTARLSSENPAIAATACRSMIRLGDDQAIRHGLFAASLNPWPRLALGIGGGRTAVNVLTDLAKAETVDEDALIALGLLGDLGSVTVIFQCLSKPDCAVAAATALQTITGAALYVDVFVPDEIDVEEMLDDERERYEQTGEAPRRDDGKPSGRTVTQVSIDPEAWRGWLTANKAAFNPKLKYRHGQPYSPVALVECLRAEQTPGRIRALVCDELVVRYQAPVALEVDMPVEQQRRYIAALDQWLAEASGKFQPGVWHFAAAPID